jgi:tetratricopeptide (TPR) repeat protein
MDQREQLQAILKTHQQGNLQQALAEYQKLLQEAPACADAHHLLGLCQLELGLLDAASASLSHAARLADKVAEFHADACAAEAACGRWPAARDYLQTARRRGLRIAERLHALGLKNLRQLEFNEAIACFELECDVVPRAAAHHNLAIALLHVDRLAEAERALNNTIQLDPNFLLAYKNRALLRERLHDHAGALADWLKATQLNPNDVDLWLHRAQCHTQLQQNEEALRTLEHAVALDPKRAAAWNNLGVALQRLGKTARATDCFQKAIKADSKLTDAHFNLGSTLAQLKQWAKAAEYFSTACHQQPDNAQYQRRLATCWSELRNWSEAEDVIARAVALQPLDGEFRAQMGEIVQHRGDIELALPHFAEAVRLNPSQPLAWAKLGLAAKRLGDADMARTAFAKLTELEGSDEARYLHAISLPVIYRDEQDLVQRRQQLEVDIDGLLARGVRLDATKLVLNTTFLLAYQGYNDRPLQEKIARLWIDRGYHAAFTHDKDSPRLRIEVDVRRPRHFGRRLG